MITLKEHLIRQKVQKKLPYDAIDLGLPSGTLWCTHNVGAENPEEPGDYYAWGETEPKEFYSIETYKWSYPCTKYNQKDKKYILDPEDDAAHVNMEGNWYTPTFKHFKELKDNSFIEWTTINKVNGCKITSKINNNYIFIPSSLKNSLWLSKINNWDILCGQTFYFNQQRSGLSIEKRYNPLNIRPVMDKK